MVAAYQKGPGEMAMQSPAQRVRVLKILLIEDDPIDAAWITELIKERAPASEVVHSASLRDAWSVLAQRPIDTVFISVQPDGEASSTQDCRELVRRAGSRPVVALVNLADRVHAAEVRAVGASFIYSKHPIWRTAEIRKQELRARLAETSETQRAKLLRNSTDPRVRAR